MQGEMRGNPGLSVLIWVSADRFFMLGAVVAALILAAYVAVHLTQSWGPWPLGPISG